MMYVFIAPDLDYMRIQYTGFTHGDNKALILLSEVVRKSAKALTIARINGKTLRKTLYQGFYEEKIGTIITEKLQNTEVCFIIYSRIYESFGDSLVQYLRDRFAGSCIVAYFGDIVMTHRIDIRHMKEIFDAVFTFDKADAKEYELYWCLEPFSHEALENDQYTDQEIKWDVTFVGRAKQRYPMILGIYEKLKSEGFRCDFHVSGVKSKDRKYPGEISYDSLDFVTLLQHVRQSRCIVEVLQSGALSPTTRYAEALLMGRNLLTDCKYFRDKENREDSVLYFDSPEDLKHMDLNRLRDISSNDPSQYIQRFSVEQMVETIAETMRGGSR